MAGPYAAATRAAHDGSLLSVDLHDDAATAPTSSGDRAAALAVLAARGLPVASGFVVTRRAAHDLLAAPSDEVVRSLSQAWQVQRSRSEAPVRLVRSGGDPGADTRSCSVGPLDCEALVDALCDLVGDDVLADRDLPAVLAVAVPATRWTVVARTSGTAPDAGVETFARRGPLDGRPAEGEVRLPPWTLALVEDAARRAAAAMGTPVDLELAVDEESVVVVDVLRRRFLL